MTKSNTMNRRKTLKAASAATALFTLNACTTRTGNASAVSSGVTIAVSAPAPLGHVVIVGGGYGGSTAAKYLRLWGEGKIAVTMIERQANFISCPMSNLVIGGSRKIEELTASYAGLSKQGVTVVQGEVTGVNAAARNITLAGGRTIAYDKLILSPGVDFMFDQIKGLDAAAQNTVLHAWKAGEQTVALRKQLEAMPDGGVLAISIPKAPYRCPPGPYERACQAAAYFKAKKSKSKVVILDANEDVQSKKGLFMKEWNGPLKGFVEYRNNWEVKQVNAASKTVESELGDTFKADVLNVIPPMRAGNIARTAGVVNINDKWCDVDWITMESKAVKHIHVLGDATQIAPGMPKSGHMANQHGKVAAAAIVEMMNGRAPAPLTMANTCYSYVDSERVVHVASVHRYDEEKKTMVTVAGSGGLSAEANVLEGAYAWGWAETIWSDMLT
jgi:sulfide dehydrogenase [flavocytochrome c] flavoprotein chain